MTLKDNHKMRLYLAKAQVINKETYIGPIEKAAPQLTKATQSALIMICIQAHDWKSTSYQSAVSEEGTAIYD